jgi:hypothetical protein
VAFQKANLIEMSTFDYNDLFDQMSSKKLGQTGQMSIKMAMA